MTFWEENVAHVKTRDMLIGAMLRAPSEAIHRRIIRELNAAGFKELSLPHMAVFRYPGPDGARPGVIAERAGMSKQAMNRILGSLEDLGYLDSLRRARRGSRAHCPLYQARARRLRQGH